MRAVKKRVHEPQDDAWHELCSTPVRVPQGARTREIPWSRTTRSRSASRSFGRRSGGQEPALTYGFVVHSRRQHERPTLGLITLNGESLPLNRRLLAALDGVPLWLFGHARVTLDQGTPVDGIPDDKLDDAPLATLLMHIATFDVAAGVAQNLVQVEASIRADTLVQPLIVLTPSRPESWPR